MAVLLLFFTKVYHSSAHSADIARYIDPTTLAEARALFSAVSLICHQAGMQEGNLEKALYEERVILHGLRTTSRLVFGAVDDYLRNDAEGKNPIVVRENVKMLLYTQCNSEQIIGGVHCDVN